MAVTLIVLSFLRSALHKQESVADERSKAFYGLQEEQSHRWTFASPGLAVFY